MDFDVIPFEVGSGPIIVGRFMTFRTGYQRELEEAGFWVLRQCLQRFVVVQEPPVPMLIA